MEQETRFPEQQKSTYTAVEADKGMYLKVVVTGDGTNYNGTVSDVSTIVLAKRRSFYLS